MNVKEMHYDFKAKINKLDSNGNRNFIIPEIDHLLNLALELFVENVAFPRKSDVNFKGFEKGTRNIEEIRTLVTNLRFNKDGEYFLIPDSYWFYVKSEALCSKGACSSISITPTVRQHDDVFQGNSFNKSSFEWRELNITFDQNGIKPYIEDFVVDSLDVTFIKKHPYLHNAGDYRGGTYTKLDSIVLTGTQDCLLIDSTHKYIVDLAVLLASQNLSSTNLQTDMLRTNLNVLNS
jgi:hypothetical protein